jgi:hypothetical protein
VIPAANDVRRIEEGEWGKAVKADAVNTGSSGELR